ncbi:hypothetical protein [uncultured Treponema sp.]|nr:hypothetical protein [uncultured Treponema sp.]
MEAFDKLLYNESKDFLVGSNITSNYQFFSRSVSGTSSLMFFV